MPEPRHHTATLALLAIIAAATIAVFVRSDRSVGEPRLQEPPVAEPGPAADGPPVEPRAVDVAPAPVPRVADSDEPRARAVGPPPDDGVLDVRITPTTNVVGKFGGGTISVEELLQPSPTGDVPARRAFARTDKFDADPNQSPIYAAVSGVPFSPYGYRVTVFVPGLNGSSQVVRVAEDSWNPQVDLTITSASAFTLRVIDQEFDPYVDETVTLIPAGLPRGRPLLAANTDSFGTAIFDKVLAGEYQVKIGYDVRGTVQVDRPGFVRDDLNVGVQSSQMKIPRGASLKIEVFDLVNYALGGVQVRAIALDTTQNRRYEGETDVNGVKVLDHIVPGRYQIDVIARGYQQTSRPVVIEAGKEPETMQFRLPRLH